MMIGDYHVGHLQQYGRCLPAWRHCGSRFTAAWSREANDEVSHKPASVSNVGVQWASHMLRGQVIFSQAAFEHRRNPGSVHSSDPGRRDRGYVEPGFGEKSGRASIILDYFPAVSVFTPTHTLHTLRVLCSTECPCLTALGGILSARCRHIRVVRCALTGAVLIGCGLVLAIRFPPSVVRHASYAADPPRQQDARFTSNGNGENSPFLVRHVSHICTQLCLVCFWSGLALVFWWDVCM